MAGKLAGRPGHRMGREIGRRADDSHPDVRPDADRDHVLLYDVPEADAGIDAVRDDIGQGIVDDHIHPDIWMGRKEPRQDGHHDGRDRMLGGRDADGARQLPARCADRVHSGSDLIQCGAKRA